MNLAFTKGASHKWWAFAAIAIGTFVSVWDNTSINIALPSIAEYFRSDLATVQWLVIGYGLTISALLLSMGRFSDMTSRKRMYVAGVGVFGVGASLASASPSILTLVGARLLQGFGSAMILANGTAIVTSVFPAAERGKALGLHSTVVGAGAVSGPVFGGFLVTALGWRSVFWIHIPLVLMAIAACMTILDEARVVAAPRSGARARFDWLGAVLSLVMFATFLLALANGNQRGWSSPFILGMVLLFAASLGGFIWWELRTSQPLLDLGLFRRRLFSLGIAAGFISFLGTASVLFYVPFYLQHVLGHTAREAGLVLFPMALCLAVTGPVSGRLSDSLGWRGFNMGGLALSATALFVLSRLSGTTSLWLVVGALALQGVGLGLFQSPNNSSIFSSVERLRYGVVAALIQLNRNVSTATSVALATVIVTATMGALGYEPRLDVLASSSEAGLRQAFLSGLRSVYVIMGSLVAVGVVLSFIKGGRWGAGEGATEPETRVLPP